MKKFAASLFVLLFSFAVAGVAFAFDNDSGISNGTVDKEDTVFGDEVIFGEGQARLSVAAASVLSNELANVILDNSGNYTFFKKQGSNAGDVEDRTGLTMYIKAFGGQEKLDMKDYTKFDTTYYGAILGVDTDRKYADNFDATYGIFVSYVGSQLKQDEFEDNKFSQNSGFAGLRGNWYIGKLFFGAVLDYGFLANKAETEENSKDYNTQSIGFSAKAGYNFEVAKRSFTIQPNVVFNSNYLIAEEYEIDDKTVKSENILNTAVAPGLKIAKTLGKCWIVSAEGKYVFVKANGDIKIDDICLPESYFKDYTSCGLGIEKIWGYTVLHLKGHKTFGGRDGYMVNAGIEFKF